MNTGILLVLQLFFLLLFFQGKPYDPRADGQDIVSYFTSKAIAFNDAADLDQIVEAAGQRKLALLGEASHGTHEYYHWRAEISKRLVTEYGFNFIAVEGDWASIYRLNKYVKGLEGTMSNARQVLQSFNRWPRWMWANTDILSLAEWLREHNETLLEGEKVGFYGMDVYGQWQAMEDLLDYTRKYLPEEFDNIEQRLNCFARYGSDEWVYARIVAGGQQSCEEELQGIVDILRSNRDGLIGTDEKSYFRAKQNALVVQNAESFYRLAIHSSAGSWNSRVDHMWLTVQRLLEFHGDQSRGIVWAHNTHVGDSRATTMPMRNKYNIGNLSRSSLGSENVFIVGFGTQKGKVNAGRRWGEKMQVMHVPRARRGSLDHFLGQVPYEKFFLLFNDDDRENPLLSEPMGHRAIGVTYDPYMEPGNYVSTFPARRYDALIFFQKTTALKPLHD
jgi:erythromycin esterase